MRNTTGGVFYARPQFCPPFPAQAVIVRAVAFLCRLCRTAAHNIGLCQCRWAAVMLCKGLCGNKATAGGCLKYIWGSCRAGVAGGSWPRPIGDSDNLRSRSASGQQRWAATGVLRCAGCTNIDRWYCSTNWLWPSLTKLKRKAHRITTRKAEGTSPQLTARLLTGGCQAPSGISRVHAAAESVASQSLHLAGTCLRGVAGQQSADGGEPL